MKPAFVVLRTHGGLGNQLFQVLFARLFAEHEGLELLEIHDVRYHHTFARSGAVAAATPPNRWQRMVSAVRVPKLLQRYFGRFEAPWRLGSSVYLDGYFQQANQYKRFSKANIHRHIKTLRREVGIRDSHRKGVLVHLRLGDFFDSKRDALVHLLSRLETLPDGSSVITNDETLLHESESRELMKSRNAMLISTNNFEAIDVLRLMSEFETILANDSTLTFWASILGKSKVSFKNSVLLQTHSLFSENFTLIKTPQHLK